MTPYDDPLPPHSHRPQQRHHRRRREDRFATWAMPLGILLVIVWLGTVLYLFLTEGS